MVLGLAGVVLLVAPRRGAAALDAAGVIALLASALLWGVGSVRPRPRQATGSALMSTAMELLSGSALLLVAGAFLGEMGELHVHAVSRRSLMAVAYLAVLGSVVAYTAFRWLLAVASPTLVSTHAYVNPVIALALGAMVHGEAVSLSTVAGAGLVLAGVVAVAMAVGACGPAWPRNILRKGLFERAHGTLPAPVPVTSTQCVR
jgi:drug/metabolite transporter (DMT)-like permease